jgi:hypothetical protein
VSIYIIAFSMNGIFVAVTAFHWLLMVKHGY